MSALTFGTRGITINKYELSSSEQKGIKGASSLYRKQTYTTPMDSLNYDEDTHWPTLIINPKQFRFMNTSVDIDDLAQILPLYISEIPTNSCTAVAYTIANFPRLPPDEKMNSILASTSNGLLF
ncbi:hypothetical protein DFH08DRAFT_800194 [Mycena albidolilacea]|uniref:Uncharacterized protein n=1 Tax=Mycena albidolilacea TaxID=1033008 RepID=A0AAD7AJH0_9AGAR|nr:hypothetical protein DFH08DRAFT_800194 [Mycena albidolilacea]